MASILEGKSIGLDQQTMLKGELLVWRTNNRARCRNSTLKECEDDTHTPEMGTWESSGIPKNSELDCKGQNTSP
jgi:hypothetical protein